MSDSKALAERLNEFIENAACVAKPRTGRQTLVISSDPGPSFRERADVFQDCIAKLGEPDRREFARMLEVMFGVLDSLKGDAS